MDDMTDARKRLLTALMIGSMFEENLGVEVNANTKIMVGDVEFHYESKKRLTLNKGSFLVLGPDEQNKKNYEVLEANRKENTAVLREIVFFKGKLLGGDYNKEVCVVATDQADAFRILREYAKSNGYERIHSLNSSEFFKPFIQ